MRPKLCRSRRVVRIMKQATRYLIGGFVALLFGFIAAPALAQFFCGPHEDIVKSLFKELAETRVSSGLDEAGQLIEVFASQEGGWTLLITRPDGVSCVVAVGEAWHNEKPQLARKPNA